MPVLKIVLGPTAVGKTDWSIELAQKYGSPIVSCDSRQIFKGMAIGTAQPSLAQQTQVKHYFIACREPDENYTAGLYELEALSLLEQLFKEHETVVMCGGSGLYIDALCNGLDDFPPADLQLRASLMERVEKEGISALRQDLKRLDPVSYSSIDIANIQRVVHALEITIGTGRPFSSFKTGKKKERNFEIQKIGLIRPREELYDRINKRVDIMLEQGLLQEAQSLMAYRNLPALNTVGYREMFQYLDGTVSFDEAVRLIKRNTRHYAKRQMTWWNRDNEIEWSGSVSKF